jgi:hypothetical protein
VVEDFEENFGGEVGYSSWSHVVVEVRGEEDGHSFDER